jgi:hypothetical protein
MIHYGKRTRDTGEKNQQGASIHPYPVSSEGGRYDALDCTVLLGIHGQRRFLASREHQLGWDTDQESSAQQIL